MVSVDAATFSIYAYHELLYKQALVLVMDLGKIKMETPYHLHQDHRTVEQPLLAAKQMIGLQHQFVFAGDSCFCLPELSLASVLF